MVANKLMIGDWIIVNDIDYPNPMQVDGIYKKSGAYYAVLSSDLSADVDMIKPIPLTKEILEKNTKVESIESSPVDYTDYVFDEDSSVVYEKDEPFMFYYEGGKRDHIYKKVKYVHELQHLLRLVGYEKEIEL